MRNLGSLDDLGLAPADADDPDPKAFHASVQIGNGLFHVEAIRITRGTDGEVHACDDRYSDVIEALYAISTGSLSTVDYRGCDYVVCITPHAN